MPFLYKLLKPYPMDYTQSESMCRSAQISFKVCKKTFVIKDFFDELQALQNTKRTDKKNSVFMFLSNQPI